MVLLNDQRLLSNRSGKLMQNLLGQCDSVGSREKVYEDFYKWTENIKIL